MQQEIFFYRRRIKRIQKNSVLGNSSFAIRVTIDNFKISGIETFLKQHLGEVCKDGLFGLNK